MCLSLCSWLCAVSVPFSCFLGFVDSAALLSNSTLNSHSTVPAPNIPNPPSHLSGLLRPEIQRQEKQVEVPSIQLQERLIEVPVVEIREEAQEVQRVEVREVVRQVPKVEAGRSRDGLGRLEALVCLGMFWMFSSRVSGVVSPNLWSDECSSLMRSRPFGRWLGLTLAGEVCGEEGAQAGDSVCGEDGGGAAGDLRGGHRRSARGGIEGAGATGPGASGAIYRDAW